ncbi:MAG: tetratricopeptide repeat protein [Bdellovibrionales bacterium]|nr:tetratricopeptide repeat protein [Bdellovibrionales bacterium]
MLIGSNYRNILILVLAILVTACSSANEKKRKHQADLYFGAGTQSLMTQDFTDALTNLLKANELDPDNAGIMINLGMAYYFKGERNLAIKTLKKAMELDPGNSDAKVNLASIYFKDGDLEKSEKIYKSVLKDLTYDKQARTLYNLGTIELQRKRISAAENYFKKSVKEESNFCPSYLQLGLIEYNQKQFNKALKNFREAAMGVCYETSPEAHYYQALTLTNLKRFNEARLKYDEIDVRFKSTDYARKARLKMMEINEIEKSSSSEAHAARKILESPEF